MDIPRIRYTKTADGVNIAYQVVGDGPFDLVFVPGVVSNVEVSWENPRWARFMRRLASFSRLILFDRRGVGISDRPGGVPTLEQRIDDLRAVLDAVGSARAALCGAGHGDGAMAALFAASDPERTSGLVLYAVPARTSWAPDYPWAPRRDELLHAIAEGERRFSERDWCEEVAARQFPSLDPTDELLDFFAHTMRLSVSPGAFADYRRTALDIDVRKVLPSITAPTVVLHRSGDRVVPVEASRYVAQQIPTAVYHELEGIDHNPWVGDQDAVLDPIEEFLVRLWTEKPWEESETDRILATVLFTDIANSTAKAIELGDAAWRRLLLDHHAQVRTQLTRFRGREIDTAGDGFLASFDGPARAIRCALMLREAIRELGIEIRAGLHAGECELIDGKVGGVAVHTGARVAGEAAAGEVLVSSTVKDLVAGSGLEFEDRGLHALKGLGDWRLYAVL